jgi:hypothetical protein
VRQSARASLQALVTPAYPGLARPASLSTWMRARGAMTSVGVVLANECRPRDGAGRWRFLSYCQSVMERMTDQKGSESVPCYFGATPRLSIL